MNSNKTVKSIYGEFLKNVDNLIYLGSEIESTDKEIKIRRAKTRAALTHFQIHMEITTQLNFKEELLHSRG